MEQISKFPVVSTVCSNCKHCRMVSVDACFCIFECECVGTKNPVDGHVTYKECKEARTLINGDWNIDCIWYKQRLSTSQKIKSFFKHPTKFTDSLPEEPVGKDLEKEIELWMKSNMDDAGYFNTLEFAKHFFELGLKAK